jgi:hypothetical protein
MRAGGNPKERTAFSPKSKMSNFKFEIRMDLKNIDSAQPRMGEEKLHREAEKSHLR